MNDVAKRYFRWIWNSAVSPEFSRLCHRRGIDIRAVLTELNSVTFDGLTEMDLNRIDDGVELRYRFGRDLGYQDPVIAASIDIYRCSMLEVIAALALKAGEQIFGNPYEKEGARWIFGKMLENSGMLDPDADIFDICDGIIDRAYSPDGKGGLFYIPKCPKDLRKVELWHQMMLYLDVTYDEFMDSVKTKA